MRVLMFGWEFPPHIAGGLGTACEGIVKGLAYNNGCAWPFLLAQYSYACFNMMGKNFIKRAEYLTEGFYEDLSKHGVGCFSELYDGDPPHEPHGAISSATTTSALLNINWLIEKYKEE